MLSFLRLYDYSKAKREYDAVESALKMVKQTGYGFASASLQDIQLSKPEVVKQGSRYGVKLKAIAPSIHMIKVDVESTFEPIIGLSLIHIFVLFVNDPELLHFSYKRYLENRLREAFGFSGTTLRILARERNR